MQIDESTAAKLLPVLEPLQDAIRSRQYRVVPSAANAADKALCALPLPRAWRWDSLAEHIQAFGARTVIVQLPLFWQVEPFIHEALRRVRVPACIVDPQNYPLDQATIRFASADAILVEATEAAVVADYLTAQNVELPTYWVLVHAIDVPRGDTVVSLKRRGLQVAEEVHVAPGVPLLVQCGHIVASQGNLFHRTDTFVWGADLLAPTISTNTTLPFVLSHFSLPLVLKGHGACACGKELFSVT